MLDICFSSDLLNRSHRHRCISYQHYRAATVPSAVKTSRCPGVVARALPDHSAQGFLMDSFACSRSITPRPTMKTQTSMKDASTQTENGTLGQDLSEALSLNNIRRSLILMEDTIIFSLIERSQFRRNAPTYEPGAVPVPMYSHDGQQYSLLNYLLRETEQIHGRIRRYTSPEENAFFPDDLPPLMMPPISYPKVLWPASANVSVNSKIMQMYLEHLLPEITEPGDDSNYGSAALYDVVILQALSRRIHYGKFVAEAKFRAHEEEYTALIKARDAAGIMELLTDRQVELRVLERVKLKASTFGRDLNSNVSTNITEVDEKKEELLRIPPDIVAQLYDTWVMPLTKEVEVEYLLKRLDE